MGLPPTLLDFLNSVLIESRFPAYLLAAKDGRLLSWGGALDRYSIANLQKDEQLSAQVSILHGLLPLNGAPIFLPCVSTESGLFADIHIFSADEGDWVCMLDATSFEAERRLLQQAANELSLLRGRQAKMQGPSGRDPDR
jgi:hypothetical protein